MKIILLITALIVLVSTQYCSIKNIRVKREKEIYRYISTQPIEDMIQDMAKQMVKKITVDQRQKFKNFMTNNVDVVLLENIMKRLIQNNFTADELKALADFYGSSAGKSAIKKLNLYRMELMPALQGEVMKMYVKANREKED